MTRKLKALSPSWWDTPLLYLLFISWLEKPSNDVLTAEDTELKARPRLHPQSNCRLAQPEALPSPPLFLSFLLRRPVLAGTPWFCLFSRVDTQRRPMQNFKKPGQPLPLHRQALTSIDLDGRMQSSLLKSLAGMPLEPEVEQGQGLHSGDLGLPLSQIVSLF